MYPLISVVVPCFNAELYIIEALNSICHQTYTNIEIFIIDDGSTDASVGLVSQYKATSTAQIHLHNQQRRGPAAARNTGIWLAKGEFIAFLDADDRWMPRKLEMQLPLMTQSKDCVLSHTPEIVVDEKGRQVGLSERRLEISGSYLESLLVENCISTSTVVARTAALKAAHGFDNSFQTCEDWDLWVRLAQLGSIAYLDRAMTLYRLHSGNISSNIDDMREATIRFREKHARLIPDYDKAHKLSKLGWHLTHLNLSYGYWQRGRNLQAIFEACRAVLDRPLSILGYKRLARSFTPPPRQN